MSPEAREALVEMVAEAMATADLWPTAWRGTTSLPPMSDPERNLWRERARAALAVIEPVVREECAKVTEQYPCSDWPPCGTLDRCAAAIRALPDDPA